MARTTDDIIKFIDSVYQEHKTYWADKSSEMKRYKDCYQTRFWNNESYNDSMIRVETADAYTHIEGYIASIFTKNPSVVIGADLAATSGNPQLAQAASNRFLFNQREQLEIASRLSLIYDYSALKLTPEDSNEMLDRVSIKAIPCWEVIVDRDASGVKDQRFIGHNYFMTIVEAKKKFGARTFTAVPKKDFFDSNATGTKTLYDKAAYRNLPDEYMYIEVVELYDMLHDELYFWSPQYSNGEKLLEKAQIPIRSYNDNGLPNIICLYFSRVPSKPMEGISSLSRLYDQIYEKNILRTYWANAVRRDSRQFLYREGAFDEEQLAKITSGIDGAMIGVDTESLEGLIKAVDVPPISSNFDRYAAQIEQDIGKSSILAPFTRGVVTNSTATEINALAEYSASELGKMAREKDEALEKIINVYIRLLALLAEDGETAVIEVDGEGKVITAEDLDSKFRISALDQGSTPLSDSNKKQNLMALIPILQQLGVPPEKMLEYLIRLYDLPKDFADVAKPEAPEAAPAAPGAAPGGVPPELAAMLQGAV